MIKPKCSILNILEEKNIIDDNFLDIVGNQFKFDHEKGSAEWLKNSVDAYIREDVADDNQYIFLRFTDGRKNDASFECIDFVGMTNNDITKAFKRWGDPRAAKRGLNKLTYGGHGNGGKFYMRQMFSKSHFITYKNNYINIFGFNQKKKYGFAKGFKNKKINPKEALNIANMNEFFLPINIKNKILKGKTGFTVVKGIGPLGMKNKIKANKIIEKLRNHPQARNILSRIKVGAIHNNELIIAAIKPKKINPMKEFENPVMITIPEKISIENGNIIKLANKKYQKGKLLLKTSEMAFEKNSRFGSLNRIDFMGEIGVIASYQLASDLSVRNFPQAAFIYGECQCPILEDADNNVVKNDRTKLIENDLTRALLQWISDQIDILAAEISSKEAEERKKKNIKISSSYNEFLNTWKNKFMGKALSEVLGNFGDKTGKTESYNVKALLESPENLEFSFSLARIPIDQKRKITLKAKMLKTIPVGSIINLTSDNKFIELEKKEITIKDDYVKKDINGVNVAVMNLFLIGKKVRERGKITATIGKFSSDIIIEIVENKGNKKIKKPSYPRVLLSSIDSDPLDIAPDGKVTLNPRQPLVYQRPQDVKERIYWINTSTPLADAILHRHNSHSLRWRDYLLQRYVEIFIKEAIFELQKKDPDSFRAERIDSDILGTLVAKIHSTAVEDLNEFLFEEEYEPSKKDEI